MEEEELRRVVGSLGGLVLNPQEAREERVGTRSRALPKVDVSAASQPNTSATSADEHPHTASHEVTVERTQTNTKTRRDDNGYSECIKND